MYVLLYPGPQIISSSSGWRAAILPNVCEPASAFLATIIRCCTRKPVPSMGNGQRSARRTSIGSALLETTRSTLRCIARNWRVRWRRYSHVTQPTRWNSRLITGRAARGTRNLGKVSSLHSAICCSFVRVIIERNERTYFGCQRFRPYITEQRKNNDHQPVILECLLKF